MLAPRRRGCLGRLCSEKGTKHPPATFIHQPIHRSLWGRGSTETLPRLKSSLPFSTPPTLQQSSLPPPQNGKSAHDLLCARALSTSLAVTSAAWNSPLTTCKF